MMHALEVFMKKIGYEFHDQELIEKALTHRSYSQINNERLEFLGDSIVNFVVASELFNRFPEAREGQLSRVRAHLVNEQTLADIAREFEISPLLRLGVGEVKSGGAKRDSILSDSVEAIIGAIYLDSGIDICYETVSQWFHERVSEISLEDTYKDPKSLLQEYMQARQLPLPEYEMVSVSGEEHAQTFLIRCHVASLQEPVMGEGSSRRRAEQDAAKHALEVLGE